jgi:hypothetical protein
MLRSTTVIAYRLLNNIIIIAIWTVLALNINNSCLSNVVFPSVPYIIKNSETHQIFIACESTFQVIPTGTEIGESTRLFKVFFIPSNLLYEMSDFLEASLTDHHIFALPFFDLEFHV